MSHHPSHHLKRLQHDINSNLHLSSHNSRTNAFDSHSRLPDDEAIRESIQHLTILTTNNDTNFSRPFKPGPQHARRGGRRFHAHRWHSSLTLPKRAINYDLAESFMDHSTNPLSSDLYKVEWEHSEKQWPNGRFKNYTEKLDKLYGYVLEITCTRTFPLVPKRKKTPETSESEQNIPITTATSSLTLIDPVVQEEKKKQIDKQANIYANLFGGGRIPRLPSTAQTKKPNSTLNPRLSSPSTSVSLLDENPKLSPPSTLVSLLDENPTDHQS